jgi:hypothetical protein
MHNKYYMLTELTELTELTDNKNKLRLTKT